MTERNQPSEAIEPDVKIARDIIHDLAFTNDDVHSDESGRHVRMHPNTVIEARALLLGFVERMEAEAEKAKSPLAGRVFENKHGMRVRIGDDGHAYWDGTDRRMFSVMTARDWTEIRGGV